MASIRGLLTLALILCEAGLAGCNGLHPAGTGAGKRAAAIAVANLPAKALTDALTLAVKQFGPTVLLTGKVKIVSDNGGGIVSNNGGGIVSDNGGGVISNNSGNVISNNGGGLVSNNGGGVLSNNGGGLTSKTKFGLLAASTVREFSLADAVITIHDATGAQLVDEHGKPITATTDANGHYTLSAVLPPRNLVMRIKVHAGGALRGGELSVLLPKSSAPFRTRPIDTAGSLGAAYVLTKYVKGDQTIFDKLPAIEADSLYDDLAGALGAVSEVPSYQTADLVARTDMLGAKTPPVAHRLEEIRALLLGQAKLGDGRPATTVAIVEPLGLALGANGALLIGEHRFGRVRSVDQMGTISTIADVIQGRVKKNYYGLTDVAALSDGSALVSTLTNIFKIDRAGKVTPIAGTGLKTAGSLPALATETAVRMGRMAVAPDGTLYLAENCMQGGEGNARLIAIGQDGMAKELPLGPGLAAVAIYSGVGVGGDGSIYALGWHSVSAGQADLVRYKPGGMATVMATGMPMASQADGGLAVSSDGTVYVSEGGVGRVVAVAPDGAQHTVAGVGGPVATQSLGRPQSLLVLPNGTLLVGDADTNLIRALGTDGSWTVYAGIDSSLESRTDLDNIPLNSPGGAAFDASGGLIVSEGGGTICVASMARRCAPSRGQDLDSEGMAAPRKGRSLRRPALSRIRMGRYMYWIRAIIVCARLTWMGSFRPSSAQAPAMAQG